MQNPRKVLLAATVLMIFYSAQGWSETSLKLTQQEIQNQIIKLKENIEKDYRNIKSCLLYTSPSPRDVEESRMPSSA